MTTVPRRTFLRGAAATLGSAAVLPMARAATGATPVKDQWKKAFMLGGL